MGSVRRTLVQAKELDSDLQKREVSLDSSACAAASQDSIVDENEGQKKDAPQSAMMSGKSKDCKDCEVCQRSSKGSCSECGGFFCSRHIKKRYRAADKPEGACMWMETNLCDTCHKTTFREHLFKRVEQYCSNSLQEYVEDTTDTNTDKVLRAGKMLVVDIGPSSVIVDKVVKHWTDVVGVLRLHEEMLQTLKVLTQLVKSAGLNIFSLKQLTQLGFGLCYLVAYHRHERGSNPQSEEEVHVDKGDGHVSSQQLADLQWYSAYALHFAYDSSVVEVQRQVQYQEFQLLFASPGLNEFCKPVFQVVARHDLKLALLVIRGTKSLADVLTDANAGVREFSEFLDFSQSPGIPQPDHDKPHCVHEGMMNSAKWLHEEVREPLTQLADAGYRIVVTGHSLGAGVAAFVTLLLRRTLPHVTGIGYATPRTMTLGLAVHSKQFFTSVVLRDDIVPRISVGAAQALLHQLTSVEWKKHLKRDLRDVFERIRTVCKPQHRHAPKPPGAADSKDAPCSSKVAESCMSVPQDLYCPGKVVHIYHVQGQLRASYVPNDFGPLLEIQPSPQVVEDHAGSSYWEALQAVAEARRALAQPPAWRSFDTELCCALCKAAFTWHTARKSEPEKWRRMQHCHACGRVVCEPCSGQTMPLPQYGIMGPKRVCDKCFYTPATRFREVPQGCDVAACSR